MAVAPTMPDYMKEILRQVCTEIRPQMLAEVRRFFHQRINKCLQVEGMYVCMMAFSNTETFVWNIFGYDQ